MIYAARSLLVEINCVGNVEGKDNIWQENKGAVSWVADGVK